jgi:molecular chaperone DnaK
MEKTLTDSRDKIDATTRGEVEAALADSKKILENNKDAADGQIFKDAFERLQKASYKMAEQLYKDAGAAAGQPGAGAPPPTASDAETTQAQKDVIDAEFEEHS